MRIAHRDARDVPLAASDLDRLVHDAAIAIACHRNLVRLEHRLAHIDAHARHDAVLLDDFRHEDARARLDREFLLVRDMMVIEIARKAADAVAAHLRLAAVRIENAHAEIRLVRIQDDEHAVTADAEVAVARFLCKCAVIREFLLPAVNQQEIISTPLPFREFHIRYASLRKLQNLNLSLHFTCFRRRLQVFMR